MTGAGATVGVKVAVRARPRWLIATATAVAYAGTGLANALLRRVVIETRIGAGPWVRARPALALKRTPEVPS